MVFIWFYMVFIWFFIKFVYDFIRFGEFDRFQKMWSFLILTQFHKFAKHNRFNIFKGLWLFGKDNEHGISWILEIRKKAARSFSVFEFEYIRPYLSVFVALEQAATKKAARATYRLEPKSPMCALIWLRIYVCIWLGMCTFIWLRMCGRESECAADFFICAVVLEDHVFAEILRTPVLFIPPTSFVISILSRNPHYPLVF